MKRYKTYSICYLRAEKDRDWIMAGNYFDNDRPRKWRAWETGDGDSYIYYEEALLLQIDDGGRMTHDVMEINITKIFKSTFKRFTDKQIDAIEEARPEYLNLVSGKEWWQTKVNREDADAWLERAKRTYRRGPRSRRNRLREILTS